MVSLIDLQVDGVEELRDKLEKISKKVEPKELLPILMEAAKNLQRDIKQGIPKGPTGNLSRGLVAKQMRVHGTYPTATLVAMDYKVAPHAYLVEYGHGGPHPAGPHPYFHPVVQDRLAATLRWVHDEIKKKVDREVEA